MLHVRLTRHGHPGESGRVHPRAVFRDGTRCHRLCSVDNLRPRVTDRQLGPLRRGIWREGWPSSRAPAILSRRIIGGGAVMRNLLLSAVFAAGLLFPMGAPHAQTANPVTATCKDGTAFSGPTRSGACRGHGGVKLWGSAATSTAPAAATSPTTKAPAAGAAPDQVWVNTASKVYHCPGTRWYGKTKAGSYMSEAQAKAQGDRPDHGKACSS